MSVVLQNRVKKDQFLCNIITEGPSTRRIPVPAFYEIAKRSKSNKNKLRQFAINVVDFLKQYSKRVEKQKGEFVYY